jgi:hypothetical protein
VPRLVLLKLLFKNNKAKFPFKLKGVQEEFEAAVKCFEEKVHTANINESSTPITK